MYVHVYAGGGRGHLRRRLRLARLWALEALQAALDCAGELGGATVEVGLGRFRVDGALTMPQDVSLEGLARGMGGDHVWGRDTWRPGDPQLFHSVGNKSVFLAYGGRGEADGAPPSACIERCEDRGLHASPPRSANTFLSNSMSGFVPYILSNLS